MITVKQGLSKKEEKEIWLLMEELSDVFGDFYITKDRIRLYIKENLDLLFSLLKKGDKIAYSYQDGIAVATGFADKSERIYIKILARNDKSANNLIKVLAGNVECKLWAKIKKNNPLIEVLKKNAFKFFASRGKELLLYRDKIIIRKKVNRNIGE